MLPLCLVLVLLIMAKLAEGNACDPGWFGIDCQYKCRCNDQNCDDDGECIGDIDRRCQWGWFGPGCQYEDLTVHNSMPKTPKWLRIYNDASCNPDPSPGRIHIELNYNYILTWIRIRLHEPGLLDKIYVTTVEHLGTPRFNFLRIKPDPLTLDLYTDHPDYVRDVLVEGPGTRAICSIHISGGRNIGLRQETSLSSALDDLSEPRHAIDLNTNNDYSSGACFQTCPDDTEPTWNVTFSQPKWLNRYIAYGELNGPQVSGLTFKLYGKEDKLLGRGGLSVSRDLSDHAYFAADSYYFVSKISVTTRDDPVPVPLDLCEIMLYGDSVCDDGRYGRDCEYTCNCANKNVTCFVSTGACPTGCAKGFQGENCHVPIFCDDASTSRIDGKCLRLVKEPLKWQEAKAACEALGPTVTLAELTSEAIKDYVQRYTQDTRTWLGATDIASEGNWVWSSNGNKADIDPSWWGEGQPDNSYGNEDCLIMRPDGFLNDYGCNYELPYFCQATYMPAVSFQSS